MQTLRIKPRPSGGDGRPERDPEGDLLPLLAGAAFAVAGVGAILALVDASSPLRGPFTLFFLFTAPATAVGAALRGLDPPARAVLSFAGAIAVDLLVAQGMLAVHRWSVRGGIVAVAAISCLALLLVLAHRRRRRATRGRA